MRFHWRYSIMLIATVCLIEKSSLLASSHPSFIDDNSTVRQFCDGLASDIAKGDATAIQSKMSRDFRYDYTYEQFDAMLKQLEATYGKLKLYKFKMAETGIKKYANGNTYPMKKLWYAITTSKHKEGEYFLFIEVIADGSRMASSGFSFVTFPGGPPRQLK
jgi:hypothetical protein